MDAFRRRSAVPPKKTLLIGTIGLLIIGFVALIALVFIFSALSPTVLGKCVALVEVDSALTTQGVPQTLFSDGQPSSEQIARSILSLNQREDIGSVLLVVNSPGGSAVASREIYESLEAVKKPKVAYIKEVGASGGYHIVTPTDYVVISPDAITGSIGAIAVFMSMEGLFDKIGVQAYAVKSGKMKDIGSPYRNATAEEYAIVESIVNESFSQFKNDIVKHRGNKLNMPLFEQVTDGRIISGRQSVKVGLTDQTGNKKDALKKAANLANISYKSISDIRVCKVQSSVSDSSMLMSMQAFFNSVQTKLTSPQLLFQ